MHRWMISASNVHGIDLSQWDFSQYFFCLDSNLKKSNMNLEINGPFLYSHQPNTRKGTALILNVLLLLNHAHYFNTTKCISNTFQNVGLLHKIVKQTQ